MTLRDTIESFAESNGCSLADLSVMSKHTDPYRMDTPANYRDGEWLKDQWTASGAHRPLHLRGLHYVLVSVVTAIKPNGDPYVNTDADWLWLEIVANKARWLGYIDFDDIVDERNAGPRDYVTDYTQCEPRFEVRAWGAAGMVAPFNSYLPKVSTECNMMVSQAYRLVLIGEKGSLSNVLDPVARKYSAELVLPTGELSTTLLHGIVRRAYHDGRPCRVFYFADFDPSGYHMPIEVSRKVQALVEGFFPGLDIQVHRCALTDEQVKEFNLPSTPLKESDPRGDKWRERWGCEQTEIDALGTLQPDVLRQIAEEALAPYYDSGLRFRAVKAQHKARADMDAALDLAMEARKDEIEAARREYTETVELPAQGLAIKVMAPLFRKIIDDVHNCNSMAEIPEAAPVGDVAEPLFDSTDDWVVQTKRLIGDRL